MIFDSLDNVSLYAGIHPGFTDIRTFLSNSDLENLATGRHPFTNGDGFASVSVYATRSADDVYVECHRKFIDVQMVVRGEENIGVTLKQFCSEYPYDAVKDLQILSGRTDYIKLVPGLFAVFFPHDAHQPGIMCDTHAVMVKKIVFKIPADLRTHV